MGQQQYRAYLINSDDRIYDGELVIQYRRLGSYSAVARLYAVSRESVRYHVLRYLHMCIRCGKAKAIPNEIRCAQCHKQQQKGKRERDPEKLRTYRLLSYRRKHGLPLNADLPPWRKKQYAKT